MSRLERARAFTAAIFTAIGRLPFKAEILSALVGVFGWALVTWAVAGLVSPHLPHFVWRLSAGLFFLTLFGWNFLREIGRKGLYALTKAKR